jgi:hypothetical protein
MADAVAERAIAEHKTGTSLIPKDELQAIIALDDTLRDGKREIATAEQRGSLMLKGLMVARVTQQIRSMISPAMMRDIMALKGTPLGFKTDEATRTQGPYSEDVVRDVIIAALMDDARIVGNEFNIISGQYYRTKEQLERKVREFPGLTQLRYSLSVPVMQTGGALVAGWASWKLNGVADRIDCVQDAGFDSRIPVRVNSGQGADAILGKATRKLMHRVWNRLTGQEVSEAEPGEAIDDPNVIDASYTVDGKHVDQNSPMDPPTDESGDPSPVFAFEHRFAEAKTIEQADGVMADAMSAELDEESAALAKTWHAEALKRLAASTQKETVVEHDEAASHPLAGVQARMAAAETKKEVDAIYMEATKLEGLSGQDVKTLYALRGEHMARIHNSRGPRSNGKTAVSK